MSPDAERAIDRRRRRLLAGLSSLSAVAVAGCTDSFDDDPVRVPAAELSPILEADRPTVVPPAPVEPAEAELEATSDRIDELVSPVPDPLEPEDIPNGEIRASIADARDSALEDGADIETATGADAYWAIREAPDGRSSARKAQTAYAAIDDGSVADDLEDERERVHTLVDERTEAVSYRGDDTDEGRLRAAALAAAIDSDLEAAGRRLRGVDRGHQTVLDIGDSTADIEFADGTVDIWDHLEDRYVDSLADETDLESAFTDALLASRAEAESVDLPDRERDDWPEAVVGSDLDERFLELLVSDAVSPVYRVQDRLGEVDRLGLGLEAAVRFEQAYRAFERIREDIEAGEFAPPETVDPVIAERERAISAAETAIEEVEIPSIGAVVLERTVEDLRWADESIERSLDREGNVSLDGEYRDYVVLRARLEAHPEAVSAFRDRLLE